MITKEAFKKLSEDEKYHTLQMNTPIFDGNGYFTHMYETDTADIVTIVKLPEWSKKMIGR